MKQLKTILFLFTAIVASAQEYVPMAVDSATWVLAKKNPNPEFHEIIVLRIEGDTIVNSSLYSKIYQYDCPNSELIVSSRILIGLIRDDITERKVYGGIFSEFEEDLQTFINVEGRCSWGSINAFNEHLLYDFSLEQGDSVDICMLTNPTIVGNIDSLERFGYYRLTYYLEDDDYTIMTEGVGTCLGIFKGGECFATGGGFLYALVNYCIGSFDNCGILTSTKDDNQLSSYVSISPNPVSDLLLIESDISLEKLCLHNLKGQLILETTHTNVINMNDLSLGIYFLRVYSEAGSCQTFKIVKQ